MNAASVLDSVVFELLLKTYRRQDSVWVRPWWRTLYDKFLQRHHTVRFKLHGRNALATFGYSYPMISRMYRTYNAPLVELVFQAFSAKQRSVRVVDIGAAIGDTVLLLDANCKDMVSEYICLDGDKEFFEYQKQNLAHLANVRTIYTQLSRAEGLSSSLVRIHAGTASAQGDTKVLSVPFDEVVNANAIERIDVLKIDVDGFDGAILAGARASLLKDKPYVIFEWHPILCEDTGNDWHEAFEVLVESGYATFMWFDKFGVFSHFQLDYDMRVIDLMAAYCLENRAADWHFDVIAMHASNSLDEHVLAQLRFAMRRPSIC